MNRIKEYLSSPATRISFCVFLFWIGMTRGSLSSRMDAIEEKVENVDSLTVQIYQIQTSLAKIQTDIEWIKTNKF